MLLVTGRLTISKSKRKHAAYSLDFIFQVFKEVNEKLDIVYAPCPTSAFSLTQNICNINQNKCQGV